MLATVDACVQFVMSMEGWVGAGIEVVDGMNEGQSQGVLFHDRRFVECEVVMHL